MSLCVLLGAVLLGCAPLKLLPVPRAWPPKIQGRKLYRTPQAFIYATSAGGAGWMDRYLKPRLPRIEEEFNVRLTPGAIIVIRPGDPPLSAVNKWPSCHVKGIPWISLPKIIARDVGLPESVWVCALPTDGFYHEVVNYQRRLDDLEMLGNPSIITSWPFLFMRPRLRRAYLEESDVHRERALATAAVEFCDLAEAEKEATLRRVADFYDEKLRAVCARYARRRCDR